MEIFLLYCRLEIDECQPKRYADIDYDTANITVDPKAYQHGFMLALCSLTNYYILLLSFILMKVMASME